MKNLFLGVVGFLVLSTSNSFAQKLNYKWIDEALENKYEYLYGQFQVHVDQSTNSNYNPHSDFDPKKHTHQVLQVSDMNSQKSFQVVTGYDEIAGSDTFNFVQLKVQGTVFRIGKYKTSDEVVSQIHVFDRYAHRNVTTFSTCEGEAMKEINITKFVLPENVSFLKGVMKKSQDSDDKFPSLKFKIANLEMTIEYEDCENLKLITEDGWIIAISRAYGLYEGGYYLKYIAKR